MGDNIFKLAVVLKRQVPDENFSPSLALVCVGMSSADAKHIENVTRLKIMLNMVRDTYGDPTFSGDKEAKLKRFTTFIRIAKFWLAYKTSMDLHSIDIDLLVSKRKSRTRTDAMRLVGCDKEDCKAGGVYQKCKRIFEKESLSQYMGDPYELLSTKGRSMSTNTVPCIDVPSKVSVTDSLISPLSVPTTSQSSLPSNNKKFTFTTSGTRMTSKQAQDDRRDKNAFTLNREAAFKIGTVLMDLKKQCKLPAYESESPIVLAQNINALLGGSDEFVTARELSTAVHKNQINVLPSQSGCNGRLANEDFENLCDAFFSHSALSQHNSEKLLSVSEQTSLLASIIMPYFEAKHEVSMNERCLFNRIQKKNSYRQDVDVVDPREIIRFKWFTRKNLNLHYDNYEEFIVEKKFARQASPKEIAKNGEKVVWFSSQMARALNGDEMGFGLSYDSNTCGGRPGMQLLAKGVQNAGAPTQKSSYRCSFFVSMSYADEILPPLIILPSDAKFPIVRENLLKKFRQIRGKYGHESHKYFDCMVAASPKGGMTSGILEDYIQKMKILFPDLKDEDGSRVLFKLDSGPGRDNADVLYSSKLDGICIYPGLPNSSEGTQEMDQLFALFKSLMERNRRRLEIEKAKEGLSVTAVDLPIIMFGGDFTRSDGTIVQFGNAFDRAFNPKHLKRAREKTGYCPATRIALMDPKCRHGLGDSEVDHLNGLPKSNIELLEYIHDLEDDLLMGGEEKNTSSYKVFLSEILELNSSSVQKLQDSGFEAAHLLLKTIDEDEDSEEEVENTNITVPGSRARQDLLEKAHTAGKFFRITNGGTSMSCDDMLIAIARKGVRKKAKKLLAMKKEMETRMTIISEAESIMEKGGPDKAPEYRTCISWKVGGVAKVKGKLNALKAKWKKLKNKQPPTNEKFWTDEKEELLQSLKNGDCGRLEDTFLFKRANARKCIMLSEQMKVISSSSRLELLGYCYKSLTLNSRDMYKDIVERIDDGEDFQPDCFDFGEIDDDLNLEMKKFDEEDSLFPTEIDLCLDTDELDADELDADELSDGIGDKCDEQEKALGELDGIVTEESDDDTDEAIKNLHDNDTSSSSSDEDDEDDVLGEGLTIQSISKSNWSSMNKDALISACKERGMEANRRYKEDTLRSKLEEWEKGQE